MNAYEAGVHGELAEGAVDLGLVVTAKGLGVALDAPVIGRLRASFDVLHDGSTKLTALSREGVPVRGLNDITRIVALEEQLQAAVARAEAAEQRVKTTEGTLTQHDADAERRLAEAQSTLAQSQHQIEDQLQLTRQALAETEARLRRMQTELQTAKTEKAELDVDLRAARAEAVTSKRRHDDEKAKGQQLAAELQAVRKTMGETEGRLRRVQTQADLAKDELAAKTEAAAAELADLSGRFEQADAERTAQATQLAQLKTDLERADTERRSEGQRATANEIERDEAQRKAQLSEDTRASETERAASELKAAQARGDRYARELEEERTSREEMVRDLAYIQSQVADLSSTRGALVERVGMMTKRETQRQRTTVELTDVLRTAEVVAADQRATAKRYEARAGKLEDQVRGMTAEIVELRLRAEAAEAALQAANEALLFVTRERDALKIDVAFFQKQIGGLQRALAAAPKTRK